MKYSVKSKIIIPKEVPGWLLSANRRSLVTTKELADLFQCNRNYINEHFEVRKSAFSKKNKHYWIVKDVVKYIKKCNYLINTGDQNERTIQ